MKALQHHAVFKVSELELRTRFMVKCGSMSRGKKEK